MKKCDAVTCKYNQIKNSLTGYCSLKNPKIRENYTCFDYVKSNKNK